MNNFDDDRKGQGFLISIIIGIVLFTVVSVCLMGA